MHQHFFTNPKTDIFSPPVAVQCLASSGCFQGVLRLGYCFYAGLQPLLRFLFSFRSPNEVLVSTIADGTTNGLYPWLRKKGDSPVELWTALFIANWQSGSNWSQLSCLWLTKVRRVSSTIRFIRSVCPSVSAWFAVLIFGCEPSSDTNSRKKAALKRGSLSEIIDWLKPCIENTWLT